MGAGAGPGDVSKRPTGGELSMNRGGEKTYRRVALQEQGWSENLQEGSSPGAGLETPVLESYGPCRVFFLQPCSIMNLYRFYRLESSV